MRRTIVVVIICLTISAGSFLLRPPFIATVPLFVAGIMLGVWVRQGGRS